MDCTSVGGFIAELRKEKGLTQAELAERVGVTGGAVSKWERGLCYPDIETVVRLAEVLDLSVGEILAGQRIQVYTPETVDTLAKESIAAYSGSERRRMLRRMGAVLAALALLAAILIPEMLRRAAPEPVSGFEQTYYEYSLLCDFDGADIGQLFAQYLLNGEQRHVFATFLVRWEDGKIAAVDKIGCELPESKPGDNSFQVYPCLWDVGEDSFQILLKMTVKEADKKLESRRDELYTVRFDEYGIPTMEFDRYLY
mgnify:CR=1 FL=1